LNAIAEAHKATGLRFADIGRHGATDDIRTMVDAADGTIGARDHALILLRLPEYFGVRNSVVWTLQIAPSARTA